MNNINRMKKDKTVVIYIIGIILLSIGLFMIISIRPREVSVEEARDNIRMNKYDVIVDVRTDEEWSESHLPNTISIPIGVIVTELPKKIPDKSKSILFICKKGIRANAVALMAYKLGYINIHYMKGNFNKLR
jgi:rhodanese-related sulfurtransferase